MRPQLALVALALVVGAFFGTQTSQAAPPAPFQANSWPPPPKAIVNWNAYEDLVRAGQDLIIPPSSDRVLMTVPDGRWFIMTEHSFQAGGGELRLASKVGGQYRVHRHSLRNNTLPDQRPGNAAVGIAFPPGSQIVLWNENATGGSNIQAAGYFNGYFARGD